MVFLGLPKDNWKKYYFESLQDINNQKWVLKDREGLQEDLDHIQDKITILENFLDPDSTYNPYAPKRTLDEN